MHCCIAEHFYRGIPILAIGHCLFDSLKINLACVTTYDYRIRKIVKPDGCLENVIYN